MACAIFLFICLLSPRNVPYMCDVFENPPIQSKVVINPETIFPKLSLTEMRSVSKLLKELRTFCEC